MQSRMKDGLVALRLPRYAELTSLPLYMDQVTMVIDEALVPLLVGEERVITPAMINNYVKSGLVRRPVGKKYEREQLAQLVMLCALKQAMSLEDMRRLLAVPEGGSVEDGYRAFCEQQRLCAQDFGAKLAQLSPLQCAVYAAAHTLLCEEMLHAEASS